MDSLREKAEFFLYTQKDSAFFYSDKVDTLLLKKGDTIKIIENLFKISGVSSYHYDLKKMGWSLNRLDRIFSEKRKNENLQLDTNFNLFLYYKGSYNYQLGKDSEARRIFEKIRNNVNQVPDSLKSNDFGDLSSAAYSFIGKLLSLERKFELATAFYEKNIRDIRNSEIINEESLHGNYNLLAETYMKQGKLKPAIQYWLKTLKYNRGFGNSNALISNAFYISDSYNQLGKTDSAFFYLNYAKSIINRNPVFLIKYHFLKAEIHVKQKEYTAALDELTKAKSEIESKEAQPSQMASIYLEIGKIHSLQGQHKQAIHFYEKAENLLNEISSNSSFAIKLAKNKLNSLNSPNIHDGYKKAIGEVERATEILNILKPTFKSSEDKILLIEDFFPIFESGLNASYLLYSAQNGKRFIDDAFAFSEKGKSILLLEAILGSKATGYTNIPFSLLERERQLKSEITFIKKRLSRTTSLDSEKEDLLFELQEEHRKLITVLESDHKDYYDLKYNNRTISLNETQQLLKPDEKLISYFYGNEAIYAIGLDKDSEHIERIPIDASLQKNIKDVHRMLGDSKSDISVLAKTSHQLYLKLVAPFITSTELKNLIIVPDGPLNYIPFGALNTSDKNVSYLMEDYSTAYVNSATLYEQLINRRTKNGELLAFAPKFTGEQIELDPSRGRLLPLPHNKREVEQILTSFDGRSFTEEQATLQNFTSSLSKFNTLHLATHAVFNDEAPEYSYLAFSTKGEKESLLYVSDLYNLQIDADLVTLSACESGLGQLKRGEGFLSLARGFFYSGASSITSTLWKINDASTATLMNSFYQNLAKGDTKNIALRHAKKSFLNVNSQNGLSHPYYWSGFIISGNTQPLTTNGVNWLWYLFPFLALFTVGWILYRKKLWLK